MNRFIRLFGALFCALSLSVLAAAHVQKPGQYVEVPGSQEFTGEMIVRPFQRDALAKQGRGELEQMLIQARAAARLDEAAVDYVPETDEYIIRVPAGWNENSLSLSLMATGDYQYAEPNWRCYPAGNPNDPLYGSQWHHVTVKSPQAWDFITGSSTVICAFVDTGIDLTHPDLAPNRVPGFNSVDRLAETAGGQVNDLNGHGTHVAGDGAAIGNNAKGVSGMGWNFKIMMIRTSNNSGGGATMDDITAGARWAAENGAKSVSASYSGVDAAAVGTTGTYIKGLGALFCYAAGNDNRNLTGFYYPDTIVVGASTASDTKASFSAYGQAVHVFAPGVNILSTTLGGGYGNSSGTSMSTPVVNGAIALIWAANPALSAQAVQDVLENNCDQIGDPAIFGKGRINQLRNVQAAGAATPIEEQPDYITTVVGNYVSGSVLDILVPNTGGPSYNVNSVNVARLGQAAGVEIGYGTTADRTKLTRITFDLQAKVNQSMPVTAFLYAWNYDAGRFDPIGQFALGTGWNLKTVSLTSNISRFVSSNGSVKTFMRAVASKAGGNRVPVPYQLNVGYAHFKYVQRP